MPRATSPAAEAQVSQRLLAVEESDDHAVSSSGEGQRVLRGAEAPQFCQPRGDHRGDLGERDESHMGAEPPRQLGAGGPQDLHGAPGTAAVAGAGAGAARGSTCDLSAAGARSVDSTGRGRIRSARGRLT